MALMLRPEPMPVEVMSALLALALEPVGEIELMALQSSCLDIGTPGQDLSKRRTREAAGGAAPQSRCSGVLVDHRSRDAETLGERREGDRRILADHLAVGGVDLLDQLRVRLRIDAELVGSP